MRNLFCLLVALLSSAAEANYHCRGKVAHLGTDTALLVSNGFGVHRLCSLSEDRCKAWLSFATAAKIADREIVIYYTDSAIGGEQNSGACQEIGNWVTPSDTVYYVEIR